MHIYIYHRSIVDGFSTRDLKEASHCAPTAPSTTLWSQLRVTVIMLATRYLGGGEGRERGTVNNISPKLNTLTRNLPLCTFFIHDQPLFTGSHCQDARLQERERDREREDMVLPQKKQTNKKTKKTSLWLRVLHCQTPLVYMYHYQFRYLNIVLLSGTYSAQRSSTDYHVNDIKSRE